MTPGTGPAFEQAMDKLMVQVDADNILAVQRAFQKHANQLKEFLVTTKRQADFQRCGQDPVSRDTMRDDSFRGKIAALLQVHVDHQIELQVVSDRLGEAARAYGHSEGAIRANIERVATQ